MRKGAAGIGAIIGIIITLILIVGVALPVTVNTIGPYTNLTAVVNETFTGGATNGTYNTTAFGNVDLTSTNPIRIYNNTGPTTQYLNETTNYAWQSQTGGVANGTIYWTNIPASWNSSSAAGHSGANPVVAVLKVNYAYQTANYQATGSTGRTILGVFPILLVISALLFLGGMVASRLR